MGRIIRRTITITETWTIVWTTDDTPPPPATTIVQDQRKTKEEADEMIVPAVTLITVTDVQPPDLTAKPRAGSQRKRRRRVTE